MKTARAHLLPAACAAVAAWVVFDLAREQRLGIADAATWCTAAASLVGLAAVLAIACWPERRRTAWLVLAWVLTQTLPNAGGDWVHSRVAMTVMFVATALQAPLYAHMALTYPSGRTRERSERAFLVAAYAVSGLWQLTPALFADTRGCAGCRPRATSLLFVGHADYAWLGDVYWALFVVLGGAFIALMWRRLRSSAPGARRTLAPLALAAGFAALDFIVLRLAWLARWDQPLAALEWIDIANGAVLPVAIFLGIATIRRHRGPLGDLVMELRDARPDAIAAALARAVGDPTLELVDSLPADLEPGRAVTPLGSGVLVHDANLAGQRELLEAAASAALLALENARLRAPVEAGGRLGNLTAREREVLALVAQGLSDKAIGERLWLTPKTVETHVRHILAKLDLPADARHNRRVLAVRAYLRQ